LVILLVDVNEIYLIFVLFFDDRLPGLFWLFVVEGGRNTERLFSEEWNFCYLGNYPMVDIKDLGLRRGSWEFSIEIVGFLILATDIFSHCGL